MRPPCARARPLRAARDGRSARVAVRPDRRCASSGRRRRRPRRRRRLDLAGRSSSDVAEPLPTSGSRTVRWIGEPARHDRDPVLQPRPLAPETLESIAAQDYPSIETIVVDDCSTRCGTPSRSLDELEACRRASRSSACRSTAARAVHGTPASSARAALRASRRRRQPAPAHRGLADRRPARDAGEPSASSTRTSSSSATATTTRWHHPGTRTGSWTRTTATRARSSTVEVFDAGLRYAEDIVLGHEDWDLASPLARAVSAVSRRRDPTVLVRKHGFTRSDLVATGSTAFGERVRRRHPAIYGDGHWGRFGPFAGPAARLKAEWSPYLSIVALSRRSTQRARRAAARPAARAPDLRRRRVSGCLRRALAETDRGPHVRRIPPAPTSSRRGGSA